MAGALLNLPMSPFAGKTQRAGSTRGSTSPPHSNCDPHIPSYAFLSYDIKCEKAIINNAIEECEFLSLCRLHAGPKVKTSKGMWIACRKLHFSLSLYFSASAKPQLQLFSFSLLFPLWSVLWQSVMRRHGEPLHRVPPPLPHSS